MSDALSRKQLTLYISHWFEMICFDCCLDKKKIRIIFSKGKFDRVFLAKDLVSRDIQEIRKRKFLVEYRKDE